MSTVDLNAPPAWDFRGLQTAYESGSGAIPGLLGDPLVVEGSGFLPSFGDIYTNGSSTKRLTADDLVAVSKLFKPTTLVEELAGAVLRGDTVAAMALVDKIQEDGLCGE